MAMTADSSSNHHSPRGGRKNLSSSWAQVVRIESESSVAAVIAPSPASSSSGLGKNLASSDSSPKAALPLQQIPDNQVVVDSSDSNGDNAGGRLKKKAWKKPSNGVSEVSPLGAISSWPALSESARASSKSSAEGYSKNVSDGSASTSQGPVNPQSAPREAPTNSKSSSATNRTMAGTSGRQRNPRRNGNGGGNGAGNSSSGMPVQGGITHPSPPPPPPPPPPPFPVMPIPYPMIPVIPNSTPQYRPYGAYFSRPRMVNDNRPFPRLGNNGRGGHFNHNGSGRRDHDRGSYDNSRDVNIQSQGAQPRVPMRPLLPNAPNFVPPLRPPPPPFYYPEYTYLPTHYGGFPYNAPPPPMFVRSPEFILRYKLVGQIDYYFSDANLVGDEFLKDKMDDQGWVPISVIAGFRRVSSLTNDTQLILEWLEESSTNVEVQGEKVRRRDEWMKWIPSASDSASLSQAGSSTENLAASLDKVTIEEKVSDPQPNDS